jgi:Domain of unknown function (DUF4371)
LFGILVDESCDVSDKEKMTVLLRYVDKRGLVLERFIGIVHVIDTTVLSLKAVFGTWFYSEIKWKKLYSRRKSTKYLWNKMEVGNIFSSTKLVEDRIFRKREEERKWKIYFFSNICTKYLYKILKLDKIRFLPEEFSSTLFWKKLLLPNIAYRSNIILIF